MAEQVEVKIKGELVPCDKLANGAIGGGFISLEECRECSFHKGTETIRQPDEKQGYMDYFVDGLVKDKVFDMILPGLDS